MIITSKRAFKNYVAMKLNNAYQGPHSELPERLDRATDQVFKKMVQRETFLLCGIAIGFFVARFFF